MLMGSSLPLSCHPQSAAVYTTIRAEMAGLSLFLKMVAPLASAGLNCRSGLIAHGYAVCPSVGLLGGVLG